MIRSASAKSGRSNTRQPQPPSPRPPNARAASQAAYAPAQTAAYRPPHTNAARPRLAAARPGRRSPPHLTTSLANARPWPRDAIPATHSSVHAPILHPRRRGRGHPCPGVRYGSTTEHVADRVAPPVVLAIGRRIRVDVFATDSRWPRYPYDLFADANRWLGDAFAGSGAGAHRADAGALLPVPCLVATSPRKRSRPRPGSPSGTDAGAAACRQELRDLSAATLAGDNLADEMDERQKSSGCAPGLSLSDSEDRSDAARYLGFRRAEEGQQSPVDLVLCAFCVNDVTGPTVVAGSLAQRRRRSGSCSAVSLATASGPGRA